MSPKSWRITAAGVVGVDLVIDIVLKLVVNDVDRT
jgi:hypothetical protein